jgi:NADH dehydrogenase [ubiquinone] 1 alpha subcomplex assembly factor 6
MFAVRREPCLRSCGRLLVQVAALSADAGGRRDLPLPGLSDAEAGGRRAPERGYSPSFMSDPSLAAGLRHHDRDRYQTALFAPAERRDALFALYAFNYEIARIRESVREPMLGLIRLQWWRDALDEIYSGTPPRRHEVVTPLAHAIAAHNLSKAHFAALLDARAQDMEELPPDSLSALENYAAATSGSLILLALEVLGVRATKAADAGRAAGIAYALAGLLVVAPFHAQQRRVYLPAALTAQHGVDLERSLFALKSPPGLAAVAREIASCARRHLEAARRQRGAVPRAAMPALLHAVLAERRLRRLEAVDHNLFDPKLAVEDTLQSLRLAWAALRGIY